MRFTLLLPCVQHDTHNAILSSSFTFVRVQGPCLAYITLKALLRSVGLFHVSHTPPFLRLSDERLGSTKLDLSSSRRSDIQMSQLLCDNQARAAFPFFLCHQSFYNIYALNPRLSSPFCPSSAVLYACLLKTATILIQSPGAQNRLHFVYI